MSSPYRMPSFRPPTVLEPLTIMRKAEWCERNVQVTWVTGSGYVEVGVRQHVDYDFNVERLDLTAALRLREVLDVAIREATDVQGEEP